MTQPNVYEIAAEAVADPRAVRKALRGEWVSRTVGERIRAALERRGIKPMPTYHGIPIRP